jgi:hypothetical protein
MSKERFFTTESQRQPPTEKHLPPSQIFYDNRFKAELAQPNLDTYLQDIYHENAELVVVFLCGPYGSGQRG